MWVLCVSAVCERVLCVSAVCERVLCVRVRTVLAHSLTVPTHSLTYSIVVLAHNAHSPTVHTVLTLSNHTLTTLTHSWYSLTHNHSALTVLTVLTHTITLHSRHTLLHDYSLTRWCLPSVFDIAGIVHKVRRLDPLGVPLLLQHRRRQHWHNACGTE